MPDRYIMLEDHGPFKKGQIVYALKGYDYGLANDDTRLTGIAHRSLTEHANGDYPSHTVPITKFGPEGASVNSMAEYQAKITGKKFAGTVEGWGIIKNSLIGGLRGADNMGISTSPLVQVHFEEKWAETANSVYALGAMHGD